MLILILRLKDNLHVNIGNRELCNYETLNTYWLFFNSEYILCRHSSLAVDYDMDVNSHLHAHSFNILPSIKTFLSHNKMFPYKIFVLICFAERLH